MASSIVLVDYFCFDYFDLGFSCANYLFKNRCIHEEEGFRFRWKILGTSMCTSECIVGCLTLGNSHAIKIHIIFCKKERKKERRMSNLFQGLRE